MKFKQNLMVNLIQGICYSGRAVVRMQPDGSLKILLQYQDGNEPQRLRAIRHAEKRIKRLQRKRRKKAQAIEASKPKKKGKK